MYWKYDASSADINGKICKASGSAATLGNNAVDEVANKRVLIPAVFKNFRLVMLFSIIPPSCLC